MTTVKCKAKDPSKCPFHGSRYRKQEAFAAKERLDERLKALDAEREERKLTQQAHILADLEKNSKIGKDVHGNPIVSVYRSGIAEAPVERGVEKESYQIADEYLPEGRQGRMTGIFASPTLYGVTRWVRGNHNIIPDINVREIRVNPDEVYVYSIRAWEGATTRIGYGEEISEHDKEQVRKYWNSGMTLTEWHEAIQKDPTIDPQDWELLLPAKKIQKVKPVSIPRTSLAAGTSDYDQKYLGDLMKRSNKDMEHFAERILYRKKLQSKI